MPHRLHDGRAALALLVLATGFAPGCNPFSSDDGANESDLPSARAKLVAAGRQHACALTTDGGVRCWGYPAAGSSLP